MNTNLLFRTESVTRMSKFSSWTLNLHSRRMFTSSCGSVSSTSELRSSGRRLQGFVVVNRQLVFFSLTFPKNPQPTPHGQELQKEKLHKIHATFQEFLADASKYYESFYAKLEAKYSKDQANKQNESIYLSILQRTIIVLGDLGMRLMCYCYRA